MTRRRRYSAPEQACATCGKAQGFFTHQRCGTVCALPADRCPYGGGGWEPCPGCDDEELNHPGHVRRFGCVRQNHFGHRKPVIVPEVEALSVRGVWTPFEVSKTTKKKMAAFLAVMEVAA